MFSLAAEDSNSEYNEKPFGFQTLLYSRLLRTRIKPIKKISNCIFWGVSIYYDLILTYLLPVITKKKRYLLLTSVNFSLKMKRPISEAAECITEGEDFLKHCK